MRPLRRNGCRPSRIFCISAGARQRSPKYAGDVALRDTFGLRDRLDRWHLAARDLSIPMTTARDESDKRLVSLRGFLRTTVAGNNKTQLVRGPMKAQWLLKVDRRFWTGCGFWEA